MLSLVWHTQSYPRTGLSNRILEGMSPGPRPHSVSASRWSPRQHDNEWIRGSEPDLWSLKSRATVFWLSDPGWVTYLPYLRVLNSKVWCHRVLTHSNNFCCYLSKDFLWCSLAPCGCGHFSLSTMIILLDMSAPSVLIFLNIQGLWLLDWLLYKIAEIDWIIL